MNKKLILFRICAVIKSGIYEQTSDISFKCETFQGDVIHIVLAYLIDELQGPLSLTGINFNPSMGK